MNLPIPIRHLLLAFLLAVPAGAAETPSPSAEHTVWLAAAPSPEGTVALSTTVPLEVALGDALTSPASAVPAGPASRVVVYFDLDLLTESGRRGAAVFLASQARQLAALGPVEIVLSGDGELRSLPFAGQGAEAVNAALEGFVLRQTGGDRLGRLREEFSRGLLSDPRNGAETVRETVAEEVQVVRAARERLVLFAADAAA
jgi:hypothetical protein